MAVAKKSPTSSTKARRAMPYTMIDSQGNSDYIWCMDCGKHHRYKQCSPEGLAAKAKRKKREEDEARRLAEASATLKALKPLIECFGLDVDIYDGEDYAIIYVKKE
jgi:protein-tyrosine-phosphatase